MNLDIGYKIYWPTKAGDIKTIEGVDYIMVEFAKSYSINYPYPVLEWIPISDYIDDVKFEQIRKLVKSNKYVGVYTKELYDNEGTTTE